MKKWQIYMIIGIVFALVLIAGSTYAYFSTLISSNNNGISTNSTKYAVIYSGGTNLEGILEMSENKDTGLSSSVTIRMDNGSPLPEANLFLDITNISSNKLSDNVTPWQTALKWEVYGYDINSVEVYRDSGTFMECSTTKNAKCVSGSRLILVENQKLSYQNITFNVYVWLDGNIADNGVRGASVAGSIGAEAKNFTGELNQ